MGRIARAPGQRKELGNHQPGFHERRRYRGGILATVPKQFEGKTCVLCNTRPSSPTGEHVLPRWLFEREQERNLAPYTLHRNDEPLLNRDGRPHTSTSLMRVKLAVCRPCNGILGDRFETKAERPIRRLLDAKAEASLSRTDATTFGEWLVKTWLFLSHPVAVFPAPQNEYLDVLRWPFLPDDIYTWTINGQSPPPGLSVWVSKTRQGPPEHETRWISLPTVVADGREIPFRSFQAGLPDLAVDLVYHAGWPIDNPLVREGKAFQMWPCEDQGALDFASLATISGREMVWLEGPTLTFEDSAYGRAVLPALSPALNFFSVGTDSLFGKGVTLIQAAPLSGEPPPGLF